MPTSNKSKTVAIVGGGITGAIAARTLAKHDNLTIHVFDQGRRGVGGRTSSRSVPSRGAADGSDNDDDDDDNGNDDNKDNGSNMRWDHGCQFFRADTPQFQEMTREWMAEDFVREWKGDFKCSESLSLEKEFFGLPSTPPFYVAVDGMQSLTQRILSDAKEQLLISSSSSTAAASASSLEVFTGTRVAQLEPLEPVDSQSSSRRWKLYGTSGTAAYHDTSEKVVRQHQNSDNGDGNQNGMQLLGEESGYDAVILTDVSSSFGKWHRASAGVPEGFATRVRERVGARVPLFAAMIAFEGKTNIPFDAASFDDDVVWFAAKSNSKPTGAGVEAMQRECWTIVSTPEYAMAKIEETPMQNPETGEFIPQSPDYLTSVPGPDLRDAFERLVCEAGDDGGILGENALDGLPRVVHTDAQRWGSAMPRHRHLDDNSATRKVISGVPYDSGRFPLAPTKEEVLKGGNDNDIGRQSSFLAGESLMLFQAGDMMSSYTPGLEGAALSGYDAAEHLQKILFNVS